MGSTLMGVARCPHCSVSSPRLAVVWATESDKGTPRTDGEQRIAWACYACATCGSLVTAKAHDQYIGYEAAELFPSAKSAHDDIPEPAKTFLQQAFETLHAPDAAAVMAGSAVDGMLKAHGLVKGSLYDRIDEALAANILTAGMAEWAHSVRLGSNRPRHADKESPHVSPEEARRSVEFAEALGNFLFVLTARIKRGIEAATAAA
jgi:hypothetical protein